MTKEQHKRKVENGEIEKNAFYFTDEKDSDGALVLVQNVNGKMIDRTIWGSICYGNGKFVAVDSDGVYGATYSTDGIDWFQANGIDDASSWRQVCYGDSKFVAAGTGDKAAYSADGIDWTEVELPVCNNGYYNSICYGNGKFIAVADSESFVVYSTDGINWESSELPSSYEQPYICYGDNKFVMVNNSGPVVISDDGINWTEYDLPFDTIWRSICYGNGKFVIADSDGFGICGALYSADGINWEYSNGLNPDSCWYVFYANDRFIAFDNYDGTRTIATSTNGINWTEVKTFEVNSYPSLLSVCYGDGKYVAVGESDEAWTSADGITWGEYRYITQDGKDVTDNLRELFGETDHVVKITEVWDEDNEELVYTFRDDYIFNWNNIISIIKQNGRVICELLTGDNYKIFPNVAAYIEDGYVEFGYSDCCSVHTISIGSDGYIFYNYTAFDDNNSLIVTIDENGNQSHTIGQILESVENGGNVWLQYDNMYWALDGIDQNYATFIYDEADTTTIHKIEYSDDGYTVYVRDLVTDDSLSIQNGIAKNNINMQNYSIINANTLSAENIYSNNNLLTSVQFITWEADD